MSASAQTPALTSDEYAKQRAREIAQEIRNQLGKMCLAMLGAHTLLAHTDPAADPALSLKIQGSEVVNYIKISLTPMDYYRMEFGLIGEDDYQVVYVAEMVCFEDLHSLIEEHTGLYTSL